jgi:hypothetical protein
MHFIFIPQIEISVMLGTVVLLASMLLTLVCAVRPIVYISHCVVSNCVAPLGAVLCRFVPYLAVSYRFFLCRVASCRIFSYV